MKLMLRLKPSPARIAQDVGADQVLYTESELKPEQKVYLTNIICYTKINKIQEVKVCFYF